MYIRTKTIKQHLIFLVFLELIFNFSINAQSLDPPTNLTAEQENNAIRINWENPVADGNNRPTLSWNTSDVDTVGTSVESLYPLFVGARFDFSNFNLNNHVGRKVKSVDLYAENPNDLCTFKLQIFRSTTWSNYDIVQVYEQPFTLAETGYHTIVNLDTTFYITPDFIFYTFGYEIFNPDANALAIFGMDEGPNVYRRGDVLHTPNHFNGGWNYLAEAGSIFGIDISANFIIKVTLSEKYNVYRDENLIATVFESTYLDTTALPNQQYCYTVKTVYVNSLSTASNQACFMRTAIYHSPENFSYSLNDCRPVFSWSAVNLSGNDGVFNDYRIYKDGNLIATTTDTFYYDINAQGGSFNYCICASYITNSTIYESSTNCVSLNLNVPSIDISGDTSICLNDYTILTAISSESNFLWSNGSISNSITISPISTTKYYVSTTNTEGCVSTDSITVFVHENPNINITLDTSICIGDSIILSAHDGISYLWNTGETTNEINVSPSLTTIYNVIVTNEFGCSSMDSVSIRVDELPTINIIGDTSICYGESTTLTVSGNYNFVWINGNLTNTITVSPIETTSYNIIATNNYHCSISCNITVYVHENPTISIMGIDTICKGESVTLTAFGAVSYLWNSGETQNSINVMPLQTTNYIVTGTTNDGCSASQNFQIYVKQPPTTNYNISGNNIVCKETTQIYTILMDNALSYIWNVPEGVTIINEQGAIITTEITDSAVSGLISVFGINECGNSDTLELNLTVNHCSIPITGSLFVCENSIHTYVVPENQENYLWEIVGGEIIEGQMTNEIEVNWFSGGIGNISINYDGASITIYDVTIYSLPTISITGDSEICYGTSTTLTASGGVSYLWSNEETTNTIIVSPLVTTSYSVTASNEYNCSKTETITVIVNELPTVLIQGNTTICYGESTTLSAQTTATTFEWSNGATTQEITANPTETTTYSVTVTDENGCSNSTEITVIVNELPTVSIQGNTTICYGESTTLSAQTTATTFEWSNGATTQEITANPTETTTYSVIVTYENGCSNSTEITVIVNELPTVSIQGNTTICYGESTTLFAQTTATVFEWNNGATTQEITANPTETTTYSVIVTYENGCSNSTEITVIVNELPTVLIQGNTTICYGESTTLSAQTTATTFEWSNGSTTQEITVNPTETTTYSVTVTDENGCSNSTEITVIVNELPTVSIQGNTTICYGESTTLFAQTTATVFEWSNGATTQEITVNPTETTTYSVTVTDENGCSNSTEITVIVNELPTVSIQGNTTICYGESTTLFAQTTATVFEWNNGATTQEITVNPTETTTYSVTVTDENGCMNSQTITIEVINPMIPIDFTANNNNGVIYLSWEGEGEQYNIYKDNQYLTTVLEKYFIDGDIQPYVLYCYHISSIVENCESEKTIEQCASTPNNLEFNKSYYTIFPNPTSNYVIIQGEDITRIEITNTLGQSIFNQEYESIDFIKISTTNFTSNIYFVKIYNKSGEKIVKQLIVY